MKWCLLVYDGILRLLFYRHAVAVQIKHQICCAHSFTFGMSWQKLDRTQFSTISVEIRSHPIGHYDKPFGSDSNKSGQMHILFEFYGFIS